jgi:hypothetical protein
LDYDEANACGFQPGDLGGSSHDPSLADWQRASGLTGGLLHPGCPL